MTHIPSPCQARYFAEELNLKRQGGTLDNMISTLAGAKVDLNPHQINAALFAFQSPLSQGVLLADEVGLGKTIEAGIVIAQYIAERKKRILLIVPASLRNQWRMELEEKFCIQSLIIESKNYNSILKNEHKSPFDQESKIVICSYNFAAGKAEAIEKTSFDLIVIDEAHRLRNVYKSENKIGNKLKQALCKRKKILLTATPLQNNLMELYGLVSLIDERVFSSPKGFKEKYINAKDSAVSRHFLKEKLTPLCLRTLRKQVTEYISYTKRLAILTEYEPTTEEEELYNRISEYLRSPNLYALPKSQRQLMTLILRKLLASSSFAISGTIDALIKRLEDMLRDADTTLELNDYDVSDETSDEAEACSDQQADTDQNKEAIAAELELLRKYSAAAKNIKRNSKGDNLLTALKRGFELTEKLGGRRKAVIFTESRRTQEYLFNLLSENGYKDKIAFLNGSNTDDGSHQIYDSWKRRHKTDDAVSGSKSADLKAAIVEEFRDRAEILIGTEAAAEGINLQFCSLVVNYDMPWNPQRIEQRIGRSHRYGQKNDVVVLNFVNRKNAADMRVYELLDKKFKLFEGLFGSSDEVLGTIESGVDFEKRIAAIYQDCRSTAEIESAFDQLQEEYKDKIDAGMEQARQTLLENFDEEVVSLLKVRGEETQTKLSTFERRLYYFILTACQDILTPLDNKSRFRFVTTGKTCCINWKECEQSGEIFLHKETSAIAARLNEIMTQNIKNTKLIFDYSCSGRIISYLENHLGASGTIVLKKLISNGYERQEFLILQGEFNDGTEIEREMLEKLFELNSTQVQCATAVPLELQESVELEIEQDLRAIDKTNREYYLSECDKLDSWGEEMKEKIQVELEALEREIKEKTKELREGGELLELEKLIKLQDEITSLKKRRKKKREEIYDDEEEVEAEVARLQDEIKQKMKAISTVQDIFSVTFELR